MKGPAPPDRVEAVVVPESQISGAAGRARLGDLAASRRLPGCPTGGSSSPGRAADGVSTLVIDPRAAKALGLTLPPPVRLRADELLQ